MKTYAQLSLTYIITYFEDFPGLVHFIYIDRTSGRIIAPNIDISESPLIPKEKVSFFM